jgi:hypothetical protein
VKTKTNFNADIPVINDMNEGCLTRKTSKKKDIERVKKRYRESLDPEGSEKIE